MNVSAVFWFSARPVLSSASGHGCASIPSILAFALSGVYAIVDGFFLGHAMGDHALAAVNMFSRDNARTPYQWDDGPNAGFTTGTPWLHVNPNCKQINLAAQRNDPDSVYQFYRKLIKLRKNADLEDALIYGITVPYRVEQKNLMAYFRQGEQNKVLVMGNFQPQAQTVPLPGAVKQILLNNCDKAAITGDTVELEGYQLLVLEMA